MRIRKGFTIIEVSLVLAIGGLVLVLVFIALPGLQRSQRDSQRKDDIMLFAENVKKYQTNNNRGALPGTDTELGVIKTNFMNGKFEDPNGVDYVLSYVDCSSVKTLGASCGTVNDIKDKSFADNNYTLHFVASAACENNLAVKSSNKRKAAILYKLEVGDVYCYDL